MFNVVCSNCGKDCQVPFRPTGDKPVYCSDCYEKMGGRDNKRFFERQGRDDRNSSNGGSVQLEALNAKLDKIITILESQNSTPLVAKVEKAAVKTAKPKKSPEETE